MAADHERSLDEEGVPDLGGPLPEKVGTGDPQEGLPPPNDRPGPSVDWGVTGEEERHGEPLGVRVAREVPDTEVTGEEPGVQLVGDDVLDDREKDLVADATPLPPGQGQSSEEAAVHVVDEDDSAAVLDDDELSTEP